jgi:hypothetical protein
MFAISVGAKNSIGLSYSMGTIRSTDGTGAGVTSDHYSVTAANRKKIALSYNFTDAKSTVQLGVESETMEAEITNYSYSNTTYTTTKKRTIVDLTGSGVYFSWIARNTSALYTFKFGATSYSTTHKTFEGTSSAYLGFGMGFDFLGGGGNK